VFARMSAMNKKKHLHALEQSMADLYIRNI
jgi:hypothetical protein